jgi:transposase
MTHAPSPRTKALEKRRLKAGEFFAEGKTQAWVARHFHVSSATTNAWHQAWVRQGNKGLYAKGRPGAPPKLSKKALKKVETSLMKGPRFHGYGTELWTLQRIAKLIKTETRVSYHPGHVWKILVDLGWTAQKPDTRARERNEKNIKQWVRDTFPRIQKRGSV